MPADIDAISMLRLACGAVILAITAFGLWRSWSQDRPVLTGLFAMAAMVQLGLIWPILSQSLEFGAAGVSLVAAALCAVMLGRRSESTPGLAK